jgi:hypothetical protein
MLFWNSRRFIFHTTLVLLPTNVPLFNTPLPPAEHMASVFAAVQVRVDPLVRLFVALIRLPAASLSRLPFAMLRLLATAAGIPLSVMGDAALKGFHKTITRMKGGAIHI